MKKLFLVLLAVLLAFSMAVVGCGGGSSTPPPGGEDDPPPGGKDMSGEWKIPVNFEYDGTYTLDNQYGGINPTLPAGYQLVIESDKYLTGLHRILEGQEITVTMSFKSDRAADSISFVFIDQDPKAIENNYWGKLTKEAIIGIEPDDYDDEVSFMEDEIAAGIVVGTVYEYEIEFTATYPATDNKKENNTLVIYLDAPHKKTYTSGAGNVAAAQAEDFITLTFTEFEVKIGSGGTPPEAPKKLTIADLFKDGTWSTELEGLNIEYDMLTRVGTTGIAFTWDGEDACPGKGETGACGAWDCQDNVHDVVGQVIVKFNAVDISDFAELEVFFDDISKYGYLGIMMLPDWAGNWGGPSATSLTEDLAALADTGDPEDDYDLTASTGFVISNITVDGAITGIKLNK